MDPMTRQFQITGLHCAACVGHVESALSALPGAQDAQVNLATHMGQVSGASAAQIRTALEQAGYPARALRRRLSVPDMHCGSCVARVETAAGEASGVLRAEANLADRSLTLEVLAGDEEALSAGIAALKAEGFSATLQSEGGAEEEQDETAVARRRFWIAAALTLPVFITEMGGHIVPPLHHFIARTVGTDLAHLAQMALIALVLAWPGGGFFRRGVPGLLRGRPDMDALVALGTSAAFGFSVISTLTPGWLPPGSAAVYFEAAGVIVTLILLGRWFEAKARARTGDALRALMELAPKTAWIEQDGETIERSVAEIALGDTILLRPGAQIPVDGEVISGESHVDEAMLTGEPIPVFKSQGAPVRAGCVNGTGTLRLRATGIGADTALAQIVRMTRHAQAARLPIQDLLNRVTAWFVPAVLGVAALSFVLWLIVGGSLGPAVVAAISVLIIACPCAIGLATPVSIMVGTGRAAQLGVLFRSGEALQRLGAVDWVAFDKTGTLTQGAPSLTHIAVAEGWDWAKLHPIVAALEARSEHPVARALSDYDGRLPEVASFTATPGQGIEGEVAGRRLRIGNRHFVKDVPFNQLSQEAEIWAEEGATPVYVTVNDAPACILAVSDPVRADAAAALQRLRRLGMKCAILSGDVPQTTRHVAAQLGVTEVRAGLSPDGKVIAIQELPGPVAFVGDGLNDAPVLATADVGLAVAKATDIASEAAGVVLMAPGPAPVARAILLSRATMRNIRQNLAWAFGYNTLLIPVAAGLLVPFGGPGLTPMLAASAMALSSLAVVLNALRLRRTSG